jgi:hypothetical protein
MSTSRDLFHFLDKPKIPPKARPQWSLRRCLVLVACVACVLTVARGLSTIPAVIWLFILYHALFFAGPIVGGIVQAVRGEAIVEGTIAGGVLQYLGGMIIALAAGVFPRSPGVPAYQEIPLMLASAALFGLFSGFFVGLAIGFVAAFVRASISCAKALADALRPPR